MELPEKIQPQYVIRAYTDIVTKIEKPIIAFDFDGTLLDSRKRHQLVLDDILKQFNISLDTADLIEYKRQGKNNVAYLISKGIDLKLANQIQTLWIENIEKENYLDCDILYPETIDLLEKYSKNNDLILITARNNKAGLYWQIDKLGLRKYFKKIDVVDSNSKTSEEKKKILKMHCVTTFIGDTLSDYNATKGLNIEFIHLDYGFCDKKIIQ